MVKPIKAKVLAVLILHHATIALSRIERKSFLAYRGHFRLRLPNVAKLSEQTLPLDRPQNSAR